MLRIVADLGNSRLKWGRLSPKGDLVEAISLPLDDQRAWLAAWQKWNPGGEPALWSIASVNPPVAEVLASCLAEQGPLEIRWYRSAADVPVKHALEHAQTAGADRALAVAAAVAVNPEPPGIVISCGTAITVERIGDQGVWLGGAIAPGLGLSARALHLQTAQLPLVSPELVPPAWGASTLPALEAGIYWGVVGAIREILTRQSADLAKPPWLVWTGGDAALLASSITWDRSEIIPDLVLHGLAQIFPSHGHE